MEVTIVQALLIGLVYYLGANGTPWLTVNMGWALRRPLISGIMVGLILGDPVKGCIVGAAINVTYLAQITAGGAQTMDEGLAGTVGTALAIISNTSAGVAVTLAVPISLLGNLLWMVYMTGDIFIVHRMDKVAASGDMLNALQGTPVIDVLSTIGTILPALGIAMNFKAILSNTGAKAYLYMLLGFILSIYLNLPMVVIGVVAVILALLQKDDNVQAV